jgi:hypothetical protein
MQATNFVTRMTGNPYFPTPTPNLALIATAIGTLQTSEAAAVSRVKGAAAARNQRRKELVALIEQLRGYVQTVADADEANAQAIIESAGFSLRKKPTCRPRRPSRTHAGSRRAVQVPCGDQDGRGRLEPGGGGKGVRRVSQVAPLAGVSLAPG